MTTERCDERCDFRLSAFAALMVATALGACASYTPPDIDERSGLYRVASPIDPRGIRMRRTDVDLSRYRFAYLDLNSDRNPGPFEFAVREALARAGFRAVVNSRELSEVVRAYPELEPKQSLRNPESLQLIANRMGPMLHIEFTSVRMGHGGRAVALEVTDLSSRTQLLRAVLQQDWAPGNIDRDAHWPMLNELKRWADDCRARGGGPRT